MKKWLAIFLSLSVLFGLSDCGEDRTAVQSSKEQSASEASVPATENETEESDYIPVEQSGSRILIAYFTWAENTQVENPDGVDVDATTSASVLLPGNTAKLAGWIQQYVGGDLFSIVVTQPYSSDYDECLDRAADEKAANARPELANHIDNMDDYDVVFLGFPNWWYTAPMAIFSFIEEYDFSGKTIIPFCTHGTGGLASSIEDITAALPDLADVLEPIGVYRQDVDSAQPVINEWLDSLGLPFAEASSSPMNSKRTVPDSFAIVSAPVSAIL